MAQQKSLPSDPEQLLQFMDDLDSDFSDDDFEGYIDEEEWLESRRISVQQGESAVSVCDSREEVSSMRNGDGMENNDRMDVDWGCDSDGQDEGRADGGGSSGSGDKGGAGETEGGY